MVTPPRNPAAASHGLLVLCLVLPLLAAAAGLDAALTITHTVQPLSTDLTRAVYHWETGWLNPPMVAFTLLGEDPPLDIFALIVAFWAVRREHWRDGLLLIGVALAARMIGVAMKYVVRQPRPFFIVPPHPLSVLHGYGYPSGHSLLSSSILGFGAIVIVRLVSGSALRWSIALFCAALILLIGFSRVYLGFHWVNDVAGGYLDGGVIALSAVTLRQRLGEGGTLGKRSGWLVERARRPLGSRKEPRA